MSISPTPEIPDPVVYVHQIAGGLYGVHTPASVKEGQQRGFDVSMYAPCVLQSDMDRFVHEKNVAINALQSQLAVVNAALIEKNGQIDALVHDLNEAADCLDTLRTNVANAIGESVGGN